MSAMPEFIPIPMPGGVDIELPRFVKELSIVGIPLLVIIVLLLLLGWYWSAEPDAFALAEYDAFGMLADAYANGAKDAAAMRAALAGRRYQGAGMSYRSNGRGDMAHDAVIVCYDGASRRARIVKRYAGAKGGVMAFSKSLAREMARHNICVNVVCPGPTDTPLFEGQSERIKEALLRAIPFRRLATPQDVADGILYFASPRANYVTGQVLSVSGGLTMSG